jgi:hypothetical protein
MTETTVATRLISGTGILRLPTAIAAVRYYSVLVDVVRQPSDTDRSFKYSPPRQRYATAVFLRDGYVIDERPIDYARRRFDFLVNEPGQVLLALKCAHEQALSKLNALTSSSESNIKTFANLNMLWDEIRFVCHSDTLIQVLLRQDLYSDCGQDYYSREPPPPPPAPPPLTPGIPTEEVSPPYPDDDVTTPHPGDEFLPPVDPLVGCWKTYSTYSSGVPSSSTDYTYGLSTDVPGLRLPGGSPTWELYDTVTGRTMRTGWVGYYVTPTLVSAEWQDVCESSVIYGIPAG